MAGLSKINWLENIQEISIEFKNSLVLETCLQFQKDLYSCGLELNEFHTNQAHKLYDFTFNYLKCLEGSKLQDLLYRVDVPESLMKNISLEEDYFEALTDLILHREAMKVFFRHYYSS